MTLKTKCLTWDILQLAEKVIEAGGNVSDNYQFFKDNFGGNATDLFYDRNGQSKPSKQRGWSVAIVTEAKAQDGSLHTLELEYKPNRKMYLKEFIDGIQRFWLAECDKDLADMDCIKAYAVARCKA